MIATSHNRQNLDKTIADLARRILGMDRDWGRQKFRGFSLPAVFAIVRK